MPNIYIFRVNKSYAGGLAVISANSKEEAENIYTLNENSSRHIINERNAIILNSNKDVDASQLPDSQRALLMESNKQFMQRGSE